MAIDALGAFALPDIFGGLFGGGAAAADIGAAGAGAAGAGAAGAGAADLAGTGTALFGGETGLAGTALAGGAGTDLAALTATPGLGMAGTAADFLAAPGAIGAGVGAADALGGFGAAADTAAQTAAQTGLASGTAGAGAAPTSISDLLASGAVTPGAGFNVQPIAGGGTTGVGGTPTGTGSPSVMGTAQGYMNASAAPAAPGAASIAPPPGVGAGAIDPTSAGFAPGSQIPGGQGAITAGGPAGPTAFSGPTGTSIGDLLSKAGGGITDAFAKNPIGVALGAGGLGYSVLKGQQDTSNMKALSATAEQAAQNSQALTSEGQQLQQFLTSGTLPPQYMAQVKQAVDSAKAKAISDAAAQGQNTDPTKNSSLAATLAGIDNQVPQMIAQVGQTLASSGQGLINAGQGAAGLQGNLYQALVQNDTSNAAAIGKSIASLAAALSGKTQATIGGQTLTLNAA